MSELLPPACAAADRFLLDLAYDERGISESVRLHVAECPRCLALLADIRRIRDEAAATPLEQPWSAMDPNILAALDAHMAGESVQRFIKLPEPEIALGAKRLLDQHLSSPPSRPRLSIVPPTQSSATPARGETTPVRETRAQPRPARARRKWTTTLALAALIVVVGGGALYVSQSEHGVSPLNHSEIPAAPTRSAPALQKSATGFATPPADEKKIDLKQDNAKDLPADGFVEDRRDKQKGESSNLAGKIATHASKKSAQPDSAAGRGDITGAYGGSVTTNGLGTNGATAQGALSGARERSRSLQADAYGAGSSAPITIPMATAPANTPPPAFAPPPPPVAAAAPAPLRANGGLYDQSAPMMKSKVARSEAKPMAKEDSDRSADEEAALPGPTPVVPESVRQARSAASAGPSSALVAWSHLLTTPNLSRDVQQEALLGKLHALLALGRLDEAQAAADELTRRFPGQAQAQNAVLRARAKYAAPPAKPAAPVAEPAEAAPSPR